MFPIFRKNIIEKVVNRLTNINTIIVNTNDLTAKQLILNRYLKTSPFVYGIEGVPIRMPSLSPTMTEGTIVKWLKSEGDRISPGDVICEVQTDKAIVALELEEEGTLAKILVREDAKDIKIGTLIALMVEEGQDWKDVDIPKDIKTQTQVSEPKAESKPTEKVEKPKEGVRHPIGPSARNILQQFGIDSSVVKSSGPRNTLLKEDVLQYIKEKQLKPIDLKSVSTEKKTRPPVSGQKVSETSKYIDIDLSGMRKTIAKRLTQSKTTIPHSYMTINCRMDPVVKTRGDLKLSGVNVSVNDFIIKAAGIALKKVPQVNSSWIESTSSIQMASAVDISIAVATPNGLITPIVKNANHLNLDEISKTVKELAEKARNGKLQPHEFQGGSFSISNLGMFGITEFTAVINPPQSAILAIGSSRLTLDDNDRPQQVVTVTLSYDGRVVEEETAAKFMETFKSVIEDPVALQNQNRRLSALIS